MMPDRKMFWRIMRRLTTEFRAFGANVIIAPSDSGASSSAESPQFLNDSLFADLAEGMDSSSIPKAEFLYGIVDAAKVLAAKDQRRGASTKVILAGFGYSGSRPEHVLSPALLAAAQKMASGNT